MQPAAGPRRPARAPNRRPARQAQVAGRGPVGLLARRRRRPPQLGRAGPARRRRFRQGRPDPSGPGPGAAPAARGLARRPAEAGPGAGEPQIRDIERLNDETGLEAEADSFAQRMTADAQAGKAHPATSSAALGRAVADDKSACLAERRRAGHCPASRAAAQIGQPSRELAAGNAAPTITGECRAGRSGRPCRLRGCRCPARRREHSPSAAIWRSTMSLGRSALTMRAGAGVLRKEASAGHDSPAPKTLGRVEGVWRDAALPAGPTRTAIDQRKQSDASRRASQPLVLGRADR